MADENSTPPGPEQGAQAPEVGTSPSDKPKAPGVSKGGIIILIAALVGTVTIAWFWPQISGRFILKAWSKEAPVDAVREFAATLGANDDARVKAFGFGGEMVTKVEDGKIVSIKPASTGPMIPAYATKDVLPSSYEPTEAHRYRFDGETPTVAVTLPVDGGWRVRYTLVREGGKWLIFGLDRVPPL